MENHLANYLRTLSDSEVAELANAIGYRVGSLRTIASARLPGAEPPAYQGVSLSLALKLEDHTPLARTKTNRVCADCPHARSAS